MEHLQTVQQIFADRLLRVPDYQRGYAWGRKQWGDLVDDLEVLELTAEHYTGTLVLHPAQDSSTFLDEGGRTQRVYDVVDGQQRLTTIVILLDAIRREMQTLGRLPVADEIGKSYLLTRDIEGQPRAKLTLNSDTHPFFERNILGDRPGLDGARIQSERRLTEAHAYFRAYLEAQRGTGSVKSFPSWLIQLHRKVTDRLKLTVYEVTHEADVGVIFEVMNNRGKPLSEMEKVKNYLLYLASKIPMGAAARLAREINQGWRQILERLMAAGLSSSAHEDQMLRAHWLMAYSHDARQWRGNDSVKDRFSLKKYQGRAPALLEAVGDYVQQLDDFSVAYCDLMNPGGPSAFLRFQGQDLQRRLQLAGMKLVRLEALVSFLPLFGAVRILYPEDGHLASAFLALCEKYAFRVFRFAARKANAGQSWLFKLGNDMYHRLTTPEAAMAGMRHRILLYAPTQEFLRDLSTPDDWYNWYALKYFLYEYEEHLATSHGRAVEMPWEQLTRSDKKQTIEHILPQTPSLPYWQERWTKEQRSTWTHDIGNLCLTFDNSSYGNSAFPTKRGAAGVGNCYANSTLFQEKNLALFGDWTEKELQTRRSQMIEWATTRWHVDEAPSGVTDASTSLGDDDDLPTPLDSTEVPE